MNPSHFPQVLRSRSRSPSPVSRRRVRSDVVGREFVTTGVEIESEDRSGGNLLYVPHVDDGNRARSYSEYDHRVPQTAAVLPHGGIAELENMANVELPNRHTSLNGDVQRRFSDVEQGDNDEVDSISSAAVVFTTHRTIPNPRAAGTAHASDGREGGQHGRNRVYSTQESFGSWTPDQVDQLRRRVKFFFMDPWSKLKARCHIPWKMFIQLVKIIIITVQLVQFGGQRSAVVEYFDGNQRALEHLLLKDWDASYETMPYPPATGEYALYTVDDLLDYIDFAWEQYYNLSLASLATINLVKDKRGQPVPMILCNSFNNYNDFNNGTYVIGPGVLRNCTDLVPLNTTEGQSPYDIRTFLKQENITIPFTKLLDLTLKFTFTTFHLNLIETHYGPTCYYVNATIRFKNHGRSGQVLIDLESTRTERTCAGKIMSPSAKDEEQAMKVRSVTFDSSVLLICLLSIVLCTRSLVRAWGLKRKTEKLFEQRFGKRLEFSDRMEFVNLWYFLIIVNDVFTIIGTAYKIELETRTVTITSMNYDFCSMMLGLGGLMAWIGILRYLSFFRKYNILILTLKTAFPNVLRFMVCTMAIYFGFMFCGWLILGPYHIKFRHLSTTSECLYSLVNGDDMFVTFSATQTKDGVVWYFSRIYLYFFISLFIYCVLSLFISVIMDTYETLKEYYEKGFPKSDLQKFIDECNAPLRSGLYRRQHTENDASDCSLVECLTACCRRRHSSRRADERTHLLTRTI